MRIYFEEVFPCCVHVYGDKISIPIVDTDELNGIIDEARANDGKRPFFDDINGMAMDENGWYEIRLIINYKTKRPLEIEAWVADDCDAEEEDGDRYYFEIDDPKAVMHDVDIKLKHFDMTLEELVGQRMN